MGWVFKLVFWFFVCLIAVHIIWLISIDARAPYADLVNPLLTGYVALFRFEWIYDWSAP